MHHRYSPSPEGEAEREAGKKAERMGEKKLLGRKAHMEASAGKEDKTESLLPRKHPRNRKKRRRRIHSGGGQRQMWVGRSGLCTRMLLT